MDIHSLPRNEFSNNREATTLDVTVLLPAHNEEAAITKVVTDIRNTMKNTPYSYEILVVDDCSTDKTVEHSILANARIIRRPVNGGAGAARKTGIKYSRGEIIVMLDADDTYTAEDLPGILSFFPEYDQVNGARTSEQGTYPLLRTPAKWLLLNLAIFLARTQIPDLNTGLKAFKRAIMLNYLWVIPDGFSCVTSMTLAFLTNGFFVKYIPTEYKTRVGVSKFRPLKDTGNYLVTIFRMIMLFRPMRIFSLFFWIIALIGITRAILNRAIHGHMLLGDIVILLSAGMCLIVGILAELMIASNQHSALRDLAENADIFERDVK